MLTDVHAHICDEAFDEDRAEVLTVAREAGIAKVIAVSETIADARKNLTLAKKHPEILPAAGLYPTITDLDQTTEMEQFIRDNRHDLVAIGEVGLDFWKVKDEAEREIQRDIFRRFISLSGELDLPLNIHSRSAGRHVIEMLLKEGAMQALLHAFDGKASTAEPAIEAGYFFSIPPSIVRSRQKQKLVKRLPVSSILLETDSPVLSPYPGERNVPVNLIVALKAVAEIKGVGEAHLRETVIENTERLFGI